jgi:hypothetical protein
VAWPARGITGKQTGIVVSRRGEGQLRAVSPAGGVTAGKALSVTVTAESDYGNKVTCYSGVIHFTSIDSQAGLPADYTFFPDTDDDFRKSSSALMPKTAGGRTVTVSGTSNGSVMSTSGTSTVRLAAATLFVTSSPASASRGRPTPSEPRP